MNPRPFLLDSTVLIQVLRGEPPAVRLLRSLSSAGPLMTTAVNVGEIYSGMRPHEEARTDQLFQALIVVEVTGAMARLAGRYVREFRQRGVQLHLPDMLIAAATSEMNAVLITHNRKHFPMKDIDVVSPR